MKWWPEGHKTARHGFWKNKKVWAMRIDSNHDGHLCSLLFCMLIPVHVSSKQASQLHQTEAMRRLLCHWLPHWVLIDLFAQQSKSSWYLASFTIGYVNVTPQVWPLLLSVQPYVWCSLEKRTCLNLYTTNRCSFPWHVAYLGQIFLCWRKLLRNIAGEDLHSRDYWETKRDHSIIYY